jgi:hypothetical protein
VIFREIDIFGPLPRHACSMKSSLIPGFGSVSFSENCDLLTNGIPLGQKNDFWLFALYNDDPCPRKSAFFPFRRLSIAMQMCFDRLANEIFSVCTRIPNFTQGPFEGSRKLSKVFHRLTNEIFSVCSVILSLSQTKSIPFVPSS